MNYQTIKAFPKAELHCHLDGSISLPTLRKLALLSDITLPESDEELKKMISVDLNCEGLEEYLRCFDLLVDCIQSEETLKLAAYDVARQAAAENIIYLEIRFAPYLSMRRGLSLQQSVVAVLDGLEAAEKAFGIKVRLLLCGMKQDSFQKNNDVLHLVENSAAVGFDLAGPEEPYPTEIFSELLNEAQQHGVALTIHAGECGCSQNVVTAIELGASRIGHGLAIDLSEDAIKKVTAQGTLLELCPSSNLQTKAVKHLKDYPLRHFIDAGVRICINTDNRTVSQTTLTDEFLFLTQHFNLTLSEIETLTLNAIQGAFIPEVEKRLLAERVIRYNKEIN